MQCSALSRALKSGAACSGTPLCRSRVLYVEKIDSQLRNVEHLDFSCAEVEAFKEMMLREVGLLLQAGHNRYDWWTSKAQYPSMELSIEMEDPNGEWSYRLDSYLKTLAVNSGMLAMLPHEALLFQAGNIQGVASHNESPLRVA